MDLKGGVISLLIGLLLFGFNFAQQPGDTESGNCSWNNVPGQASSGEWFDGQDMTAAHKTLPFNTIVSTTYNGTTVTVRINDRGPYYPGRILDISEKAAKILGVIDKGAWPCTFTIDSVGPKN